MIRKNFKVILLISKNLQTRKKIRENIHMISIKKVINIKRKKSSKKLTKIKLKIEHIISIKNQIKVENPKVDPDPDQEINTEKEKKIRKDIIRQEEDLLIEVQEEKILIKIPENILLFILGQVKQTVTKEIPNKKVPQRKSYPKKVMERRKVQKKL